MGKGIEGYQDGWKKVIEEEQGVKWGKDLVWKRECGGRGVV